MKRIIGGVRIFCVMLCIMTIISYTNLNYAQEQPRRISMDFQEAALKDVLKIFSQQAGLNFVAAEEIENKKVTLYLDGITVQDALNSILEANNLTYEQKPDSVVFIVKESTEPRIKMVTKIYNLNYAKVSKGITAAGGVTAAGAGAAFSGAGGIGIGGAAPDIRSIIENLLTKDDSDKTLGSVLVDVRTNSLIITAVPEDFPIIEDTLAKLDTRTLQVMIEAEIVEVKSTAIKKLGLEWGGNTSGTFFTFTGPSRDTGFPFIRETGIFSRSLLGGSAADARGRTLAASSTGTKFGNITLADFRIVLKALEKDNKSRYLAKPKIMVVNNETAEIKISEDTAVASITTETAQSGTITTSPERMETGVILRVTPTINKDDYITMTLEPEISRVQVSNISSTTFDPVRRSAKTTVMMKNGQTIAIGGLLKTDIADNKRLVPGLSKIPLLGGLFKSTDFEDVTTEIIIFVTCYIVKPELEKKEVAVELPPVKISKREVSEEAAVTERDKEILKAVKRLRKKRELK